MIVPLIWVKNNVICTILIGMFTIPSHEWFMALFLPTLFVHGDVRSFSGDFIVILAIISLRDLAIEAPHFVR
jgi:hypothetical protein